MIPRGFLEDPFVYPSVSCAACKSTFRIVEPFFEYSFFECPKCETRADLPEKVIWDIAENIEFFEHLKKRRGTNFQPPIFPAEGAP